MAYNKGDKFIIEIEEQTKKHGETYYPIKNVPYLAYSEALLGKLKKVEEEKYRPSELEKFKQEAFEKGMEEAWKIAGLISAFEKDGGINGIELEKVFGFDCNTIFVKFSVEQVKELIEKHFPEKLSPPSYNVGDIVERDGCRAIVLDADEDFVSVWDENGSSEAWSIEKVTKIDAHCDLKPILEFISKRK